jgi:adenylate cyclase
MTHLSISLLGAFRVVLDGEPITAFEYDKVRALLAYLAVESEQALRLAQRAEDPLQIAWAYFSLGWVLDCVGDFFHARDHLEHVSAFYDPEQHRSLALFRYGSDPGVFALSWVANSLWYLGYPDQALHRSQEALAVAQELDHPFTLRHRGCAPAEREIVGA